MAPTDIQAASDALTAAVNTSAIQGGQQIEQQASQLAPGLATGSNAPGGYNYQLAVAPVVPAINADLVTQAKQALLKQVLKDATYNARKTYDDENFAMRARQREYTERKAREAEAREKAYYSSLSTGGGAGTGGGANVGATNTTARGTYRQELQKLTNAGNQDARVAIKYAGDNGRYDGPVLSQAEYNAMKKIGVTGNYYVKGTAPASQPFKLAPPPVDPLTLAIQQSQKPKFKF